MWQGSFHGAKPPSPPQRVQLGDVHVTGLFSPQDRPIERGVRPLIQNARDRIDVSIFFLTHKLLTADLIAAHRRGVRVRVLLDATAATNGYSKHALLRAAGIPVKVEDFGGKMHAKAAVIDNHTVITGSMNWTSAGEGGNDENTLLLRSPRLATQFAAWFNSLWDRVDERWLHDQPLPEGRFSGTACTDGVDNDFDHAVDGSDTSCASEDGSSGPPLPVWFVPKQEGVGLLKGFTEHGRRVWVPEGHERYRSQPAEVWLCSRWHAERLGYKRLRGTRTTK